MSGNLNVMLAGAALATYSGTITQGTNGTINGYSTSNSVGSISPGTMSDGMTVKEWYDAFGQAVITVSGFSSDPGIGYLGTSAMVGAVNKNPSGATYSYSAGAASWTFSSTFGFATSGTVSASVP